MCVKIKYEFHIDSDGFPDIKSNLIFDGLDLLGLIGSDTGRMRHVKLCIARLKRDAYWWSNASKIDPKGNCFLVTPAFDWGAKAKIRKKDLICMLEKYKEFLKANNIN